MFKLDDVRDIYKHNLKFLIEYVFTVAALVRLKFDQRVSLYLKDKNWKPKSFPFADSLCLLDEQIPILGWFLPILFNHGY